MSQQPLDVFVDESVPVHPDDPWRSPMVVYGDHGLCAGVSRRVQRMPRPHMHSQIEVNYILKGRMAYRIDGREMLVEPGRLTLFWGMIPHQVTDLDDPTYFVCLYAPMSIFLGLPTIAGLRDALFKGGVIEATVNHDYDRDVMMRWQEELLSASPIAADIVKDELCSRIRRIDRDGWRDLRRDSRIVPQLPRQKQDLIIHVERMSRFIAEHAHEDINVEAVAQTANIHPNYAISLYKRVTGMTINQAIIRERLNMAQTMLISTDNPVSRVASNAGFGSLSSFYSAFEKRFSLTPVGFRRAYVARLK